MKRIFFDGDPSDRFEIDGSEHHYLKNVMRVSAGYELNVLTPAELLHVEVIESSKKSTVLKVISRRSAVKPVYSLKVYQCLLKREYMDFAIEKFAELGVTEIVPVISEFSLNELKDKTKNRFFEIVKGAALQSENEFLPEIRDAVKIESIEADKDTNIIFYERGNTKFLPENVKGTVSMIIGAEGGFSEDEVKMLVSKGFIPYTPISSILKAETASVVFSGMVRSFMEMNIG